MASCLFFIAFFSFFVLPNQAYAYLDPGTGSVILQVVAAAVLGALFTIKMYWRKVKMFFQGLFSSSGKSTDDAK